MLCVALHCIALRWNASVFNIQAHRFLSFGDFYNVNIAVLDFGHLGASSGASLLARVLDFCLSVGLEEAVLRLRYELYGLWPMARMFVDCMVNVSSGQR